MKLDKEGGEKKDFESCDFIIHWKGRVRREIKGRELIQV